jgi:hypothetical protein
MGLVASGTRGLLSALLAGVVAFAASSCAERYVMIQTGIFPRPMIFDDSLEWAREGGAAIQTIHDYDVAKDTAYGSMGTLEGLHKLVPDNEDGLLLLTKSWSGIAFGFMDDEREEAVEKKDEQLAAYHEARARAGFKRAKFYGEEMVALHADGYKAALKNADTLRAFLKDNFDDEKYAEELLWLAFSIVGRVGFDLDNPETVAELWIGVELLEHVTRLDPKVEYGSAYTMLGAAHAGLHEYTLAKTDFENALKVSGGKLLTTQVAMAMRYYCPQRDKANYFALLQAVLAAGDTLPEQRLTNTIAKRRAQRYLNNKIWQEECAFDG